MSQKTQNYRRRVTLFNRCHVGAALGYAERPETTVIPSRLLGHTVMGALLGALLALALLTTNSEVFKMMAHSPSPMFDVAFFIGVFSFMIAAGASFSGFILSTIEIESQLAKRRGISPRINRRDFEK